MKTHILLTIITAIYFVIIPIWVFDAYLAGMPRRYYDYSYGYLDAYETFSRTTKIATVIALILIAGQLTYFINLIAGLLKKSKTLT